MIKAVIFDMDGVLVDTEPLYSRVFKETFKDFGVEITDEYMLSLRGKRLTESLEQVYRSFALKGRSHESMKPSVEAALVAVVKNEAKLMPGVRRAFKVCNQAGLPMAIASSSNYAIINAVVDTMEIRECFDRIYSAEHEPYGKPNPGVFLKTAGLLKINPEYCLVFEDSPSGVLAAKAARMKCVAVPEPGLEDDKFIKTADVILSSLEQFDKKVLAGLAK